MLPILDYRILLPTTTTTSIIGTSSHGRPRNFGSDPYPNWNFSCSHIGFRIFRTDQPKMPPPTHTNWKTLCSGLVCEDYHRIPKGYRLFTYFLTNCQLCKLHSNGMAFKTFNFYISVSVHSKTISSFKGHSNC